MDIQEQSGLRAVLSGTPLPKVCLVRQNFPRDGLRDPAAALGEKLPAMAGRIHPGDRVALTGSSRQIANMAVFLRELASFVK